MSSTNNQNYGVKESRVIEWSQGVAESVHRCSGCQVRPYLVQLCSRDVVSHASRKSRLGLLCLGFPLQFLLHTFYHSSFFGIIVLIVCTAHTSIPGPSLPLVLSTNPKNSFFGLSILGGSPSFVPLVVGWSFGGCRIVIEP